MKYLDDVTMKEHRVDWEISEQFENGGVALEGMHDGEIYSAYGDMDWDEKMDDFVWVETDSIERITQWRV